MIHWFIQDDGLTASDELQRIMYMVQEMGMAAHPHKYIPFGGMEYPFLPDNEPVIALASITVLQDHQTRNLPFKPFSWFDQKKMCCSTYYAHYGEFLLQERYGLYPLAEIIRQCDWLYETYGEDNKIFIKPDTNDKAFTGGVVKKDLFLSWAKHSNRFGLVNPDQLCVVSTPVKIDQEWRLFVADKKVVAASLYSQFDMLCVESGCPNEVVEFAEKIAEIWNPHPIFVCDIASAENGLKLIEVGSANCAGFYKCELKPIVEAMAKIAEREFYE